MLMAALRDLQWRRRRFLVAVIGTSLVFAMSLLTSGLTNSFRLEVDRVLDMQDADGWVAPAGSPGPFSAGLNVTPFMYSQIANAPGITEATPVALGLGTARVGDDLERVILIGVEEGGFGGPTEVVSGTATVSGRKVVTSKRLGVDVGETFMINGREFEVVGLLERASLFAGGQLIYMANTEVNSVVYSGISGYSFVMVKGDTSGLSDIFRSFDRGDAKVDLIRPVDNALRSIDLVRIMLWIVAALIVGSVVYITALERTRDIAVFKATGVTTASIALGVCVQAVIMALAAAILGGILAIALQPVFPLEVLVPGGAIAILPAIAVGVGVVAGLFGIRRTVTVDPTTAFGGP